MENDQLKSNENALQTAYILHSRPYRETSLMIDFFTKEKGRITAVARGARKQKSKTLGQLQPFHPLYISWFGKNELVTLKTVESINTAHQIKNKKILCALYINELLVRLLHRDDPHPNLFVYYQETLMRLERLQNVEITLRLFEINFLRELGYGLQLDRETNTDTPIQCDQLYQLTMDSAIKRLEQSNSTFIDRNRSRIFRGESLLCLHKGDLSKLNLLSDAKRLLRLILTPLLGDRPLKSRELFLNNVNNGKGS